MPKHFLDIKDVSPDDLKGMVATAKKLKHAPWSFVCAQKTLACIFEKNSTRTRVSFEMAMRRSAGDLQLGRGEPISDTAKVLSRYVDILMFRAHHHEKLQELAYHSSVPVINGLTCHSHPCQVLADILTIEEEFGSISGLTIAWLGDTNNVCRSWIEAAKAFGCTLKIACPAVLAAQDVIPYSIQEAVHQAHVVVTDTFVSMGCVDPDGHKKILAPYQVTPLVMEQAHQDAIFLHCLPAVRGEEVAIEVIDGAQSRVLVEAENRVYVQQAIICWCLGIDSV
jgi:ornithine carbamoyltransferase